MATGGDGSGGFKDPGLMRVQWASEREKFAAMAVGLRVVMTQSAIPKVQVQILDPAPGGGVRVANVVPGDHRHMELYQQLITPESEWGKD